MKRFWEKVKVLEADQCWEWQAGTDGSKMGYGVFRYEGKTCKAHRVSYELAKGKIPEGSGYHGMCVCHKCDNPTCVNPDHLFLGSQKENILDRNKKGRHPRVRNIGELAGGVKLRETDVINIRAIKKYCKITNKALAEIYSVSRQSIDNVINRKKWAHVQ